MKKEQFDVGMRVVAVDMCDGEDLRGKTGTVRAVGSGWTERTPIGVEFDKAFDHGHTLTGRLKKGSRRGWWCECDSLMPLDRARFMIETIGTETTVRGYINGREISGTAKCAAGDTPNAYVGALMALQKAFGVEYREAKSGEHVVVVRPRAAEGYTMGDVLQMVDQTHGKKIEDGSVVFCVPAEYAVVRDPAIFQPPKRERKAVCIKAQDDSPFREGRIYTVEGDGTIHTVCGKMQTHQQEDARRIAAGKNRFLVIDEEETEAAK